MRLTPNFSLDEFAVSASYPELVKPVPPEYMQYVADLADLLQEIRDLWGKPMKVLSGYRSPELNSAVGGSPTSQHKKAQAADISTEGVRDFYKLLFTEEPKFLSGQIIGYPDRGFVHIATPSVSYPKPAFFLSIHPKTYTRISSLSALGSLW